MHFEDFALYHTFTVPAAVIQEEAMLDFARKFDNIPLHTDKAYAQATRFGQVIAPGMFSFLAVWARCLEAALFGEELVAGKSSRIEWMHPVFAGNVLTAQGEVTALTRRNPRNGLVEFTFRVYNQKNELVLTNITEAVVSCRPEQSNSTEKARQNCE